MRKISILSLLFLAIITFGQGIKFEETSFASTLAKAKKEKKMVFIDAYASWCGPCKLMAKNIFPLLAVGDVYNKNFISTKIDMEKGEGIELAKKYNVRAYPSYLFVDSNGEILHRTLGYMDENKFIEAAKEALDPNKRLSTLKEKFEKGEKDPEFLLSLAIATIQTDNAFCNRVLDKYFAAKPAITKENIPLIVYSIKDDKSGMYQVFKQRKEDILHIITEPQYKNIDLSIKKSTALSAAYDEKTKQLNKDIFLAKLEGIVEKQEAKNLYLKYSAKYALKNKDFATYEKNTEELYQDTSNISSEELNSIAWGFFENTQNKASLEKAVNWAKQSVSKNENYANLDTLANLYNKLGDKVNARKTAEKSIALAKQKGEDSSDTEKLLQNL